MAPSSPIPLGYGVNQAPISSVNVPSSGKCTSSRSITMPSLLQRSSSKGTGTIQYPTIPITPNPRSLSKTSRRKKTMFRKPSTKGKTDGTQVRLNKFVRRLYDMLVREKHSGIVTWRRGLLVLFSTDAFSKKILPKYFNTRNFKTFRRQLNYYGFVHVRSFSATGNTTTALWINQHLAEDEANDNVSAVLKLRRVEADEVAKTVEGRRIRKELAIHTVEEDIGLTSNTLRLDQIRSMAIREESSHELGDEDQCHSDASKRPICSQTIACVEDIPRLVNYSSNETEEPIECSSASSIVMQIRSETDEVANADAAANVLLMLSRS